MTAALVLKQFLAVMYVFVKLLITWKYAWMKVVSLVKNDGETNLLVAYLFHIFYAGT